MEIHRFEAAWIAASILLIVAFIATVTYGAVGVGIEMVDAAGGTVEDPSNPTESPAFEEPGVTCTPDASSCDVYVIARQFQFQPGSTDPIRIPAGTPVTFHMTSPDVIHGFEVPGTNLNTMVIPGQVTRITVTLDRGEYGIVCNEYCGAAHHTMSGRIVAEPPAEFSGGGG